MAALLAGLPESVAGVTVNRLCASGLAAVVGACHAVIAGDGDLFVAGGVESMSRAPLVTAKPDTAFPRGDRTMYDTVLGWRFPNPRLAAMFPLESMGETGENVAERWQRLARGSGRLRARVAAALGQPRTPRAGSPTSWSSSRSSLATSTRGPTPALEKLAALKPGLPRTTAR